MPIQRRLGSSATRYAKDLRVWPPLNIPATSAVKAALRLFRARPPAFLVKHVPRVGKVRVQMPNGRSIILRSRGDDGLTGAAYWLGWSAYEPEVAPVFYELARESRVILDVGAHIGYYSIVAGLANPTSTVYAFEPLARVYDRLVENISLNQLRNVSCVNAAAGERSGTSTLYHEREGIPVTSSTSAAFVRGLSPSHAELAQSEVSVLSIDDFLQARGQGELVDLVKIDVESSEESVLRGMRDTLSRNRPKIICEVLSQDSARRVEDILRPLGYSFGVLTTSGVRPLSHLEADPCWHNFLGTPRP